MAHPWKRTLLALVVFGTAFGYLEAAVVTYLRQVHEPARQRFHPGRAPSELFPLLTLDQLRAGGAEQQRTLVTEVGREVATIVMLAAVALAVARNAGQWAAAFVVTFGMWDITFYVFLKLLLGWPASVFTWDILFLVPVPWAGPVLAPVLVSAVMIGAGVWHLRREAQGEPITIAGAQWAGVLAGAGVIVTSFAMDYRNLMAGGMPHPFDWGVFWAGLLIGVGSYAWAARAARRGAGRARGDGERGRGAVILAPGRHVIGALRGAETTPQSTPEYPQKGINVTPHDLSESALGRATV
ncbi:MAG: hypothetical protein JST11_12170 [Acidobacteria bacterium]|nr:hypothetical protein [Acidobacteriota bacterium]